MKFPEVTGSNLEFREFKLPYDFQGVVNLLIISFKRSQHLLTSRWIYFFNKLVKKYTIIECYELYTVNRRFKSMRFMIDEGMRTPIPNKITRERTITLYIKKKPFKMALDIPNEKAIYLFLVKTNGDVLWHTSGNFDETKGNDLMKVINELIR